MSDYDRDSWWRGEPDFYESSKWGKGKRSSGAILATGYTAVSRCYETHQPLKLGDTGLEIHGGSCSYPVVKDADVYVGFDTSMKFTSRHWPWELGHEILFKIPDMGVPEDAEAFKKLLHWTIERLIEGHKVHAGCIGGHGRTGMFLAAMVSVLCDEKDAVTYVRNHYCRKAVETETQIEFLWKHFGIKPVASTKTFGLESKSTQAKKVKSRGQVSRPKIEVISPIPRMGSIWDEGL